MSSGKAFVIHSSDNVATALTELSIGEVTLLGESPMEKIHATEAIRMSHKIALANLNNGDAVIKYGVVIGTASQAIQSGEWIHLHNLESQFDERSNTLDNETGAPTEDGVYQ
ncbi:UxaA family hydrolase [Rubellicoccus peritrichatus]|uniref:UxaA family hydrolase n=1 Tax=Rubellicoccus peritrichatus TaxID=3080537 RepID=A0AAQ3LD23_9BACT|nr:UxaA family hydrolase [Puniceicoccus sp. CR14]WOO39769.1 UxaA family hydrolase [Puniceicoccus sp. CR14]